MENSLAQKHPELSHEWSSKNLPITPEMVTYGSNKKYWWKGKCGHEWQASAKSRSNGEGCPICSNARIVPGINDLLTLKPELCKEWSEKNAPLEPYMISVGTNRKVIWKCKEGHEWSASVHNRTTNETGCPYCSHNMILPGFNDLASRFPEVAAEWSDKNLPLKPDMVTAFRNKKAWWKCRTCGNEWYTLISTRSGGSKCPYCSGIVLLRGFNDLATTNPVIAKEWSERNLPLTAEMVNERSTKNVWWKCGECGNEWKSVIRARVKGTRCPVCAERAVLQGYNDLATTDPDVLNEWDYEKNTDISPTQISRQSLRFVWWKCAFGHTRRDRVANRAVLKKRCPTCEAEFEFLLPKLLIIFYGKQLNMKVLVDDESLIGVPIDAYVPSLQLAFSFLYKGTQFEAASNGVIDHLCKVRSVQHISIQTNRSKTEIATAIRQAFGKAHIFIKSDIDEDLERLEDTFFRWRRSRI